MCWWQQNNTVSVHARRRTTLTDTHTQTQTRTVSVAQRNRVGRMSGFCRSTEASHRTVDLWCDAATLQLPSTAAFQVAAASVAVVPAKPKTAARRKALASLVSSSTAMPAYEKTAVPHKEVAKEQNAHSLAALLPQQQSDRTCRKHLPWCSCEIGSDGILCDRKRLEPKHSETLQFPNNDGVSFASCASNRTKTWEHDWIFRVVLLRQC